MRVRHRSDVYDGGGVLVEGWTEAGEEGLPRKRRPPDSIG